MNLILWDNPNLWEELLPLTFTRPISEIRIGILTIKEKWQHYLGSSISYCTKEYLTKKFPLTITTENLILNSSVLPDEKLIQAIKKLSLNEALYYNELFIVAKLTEEATTKFLSSHHVEHKYQYPYNLRTLTHFCDIFLKNGEELFNDFALLTKNRKSQPLSETNTYLGPLDLIFIEKGAIVESCTLNTKNGPIYIGKEAEIMEGSLIRGPFAMNEHSIVKMGAKIYGPTTIGPYSKVGGEINNSVIFGYSNKAHDGFLGNSVIGEWCNLGANTNNSNLKNNYEIVKMWNYPKQKFLSTGLQFAGLIMGDHSKCGINTMFNTGTVVGVSCNLFGDGYHRNFVPSFSWGGPHGYTHYKFDKALETAKLMMTRRNIELADIDKEIFLYIYTETEKYRQF